MDVTNLSAIEILQEIEKRSHARLLNEPGKMTGTSRWAGIAFRLAGLQVVASMDEISEIFNLPATLTRVPGASIWVRGVANIRGSLLPIMDLQAFLGGKPVAANRRSRVLVVRRDDLVTGLLVGDVIGMKHFSEKQSLPSVRVDSLISRFVSAAYKDNESSWPVVSIDRLINDELFRKAAA